MVDVANKSCDTTCSLSLTHSLTHSLARSLARSLTRSLTSLPLSLRISYGEPAHSLSPFPFLKLPFPHSLSLKTGKGDGHSKPAHSPSPCQRISSGSRCATSRAPRGGAGCGSGPGTAPSQCPTIGPNSRASNCPHLNVQLLAPCQWLTFVPAFRVQQLSPSQCPTIGPISFVGFGPRLDCLSCPDLRLPRRLSIGAVHGATEGRGRRGRAGGRAGGGGEGDGRQGGGGGLEDGAREEDKGSGRTKSTLGSQSTKPVLAGASCFRTHAKMLLPQSGEFEALL